MPSDLAPRITIPFFPRNKRVAVTFSFDDGVITDLRILERFNEWGLKATFNVNSGLLGGEHYTAKVPYLAREQVAQAYAGHEVAIHTVSHPFLTLLDSAGIVREVMDDKATLEDIVGYPVRGMAYPYGVCNQRVIEVLRALGIVYARTTQSAWDCFPAAEPLAWGTTCHQYAADLSKQWNDAWGNPRYFGAFFVWGHSYEFEVAKDWGAVERIFQPLAGKLDVWYCTNIELFDYEAARSRLMIAANRRSAYNPSALPVTVLVDGQSVDVPGGATVALGS